MKAFHLHLTVPSYLEAVRVLALEHGREALVPWDDMKALQVGCKFRGEVHAVKISTFRQHYGIRRELKLPEGAVHIGGGTRSLAEAADLYHRDLEAALGSGR